MAHYAKVNNNLVEQVIVANRPIFLMCMKIIVLASGFKLLIIQEEGVYYNNETDQPGGGIPLRYNYAGGLGTLTMKIEMLLYLQRIIQVGY